MFAKNLVWNFHEKASSRISIPIENLNLAIKSFAEFWINLLIEERENFEKLFVWNFSSCKHLEMSFKETSLVLNLNFATAFGKNFCVYNSVHESTFRQLNVAFMSQRHFRCDKSKHKKVSSWKMEMFAEIRESRSSHFGCLTNAKSSDSERAAFDIIFSFSLMMLVVRLVYGIIWL